MNPHIKLVIGLTGKKCSGKDTAYIFLREAIMLQTTLQVYRQAFADELKQEVASLFGGTVEAINRNKKHDIVRQAMQNHGQERRIKSAGMCWIEQTAKILPLYECPCVVVFTDVRHENEAYWIKRELNGVIIRIYRKETDEANDTHISETSIANISSDYSINNDWTMLRLKIMCKDLATQMRIQGLFK